MELREKKDIKILLGKFSESGLGENDKKKLSDLLLSPDNENLFVEDLNPSLRDFDETQGNNDFVDFDHIYKNLVFKLNHQENQELENRKIRKRDLLRRIIIQGISIAAVFILAFYLGNNLPVSDTKKIIIPENQSAYSEIRTPFGAKSEVTLSDGTRVMINAGSVLRYGNDFNLKNRNLVLEGEAYFEVAKNINLPLIVDAGKICIKAVGTQFNVKAYKDEGIIETTLIEGSIEIIENRTDNNGKILLDLKPNQKAFYIKESNLMTINTIKEIDPMVVRPAEVIDDKVLVSQKVDVKQVVAWTQNELIIKSESLENLSIKLQRKYDVRIIFGNNNIKAYRFSGILRDEPIEQVLDAIKLTAPIIFLIDGKTVLLLSNKDQTTGFPKH